MSDNDLIRRIDAMQACQVGPSDEWSKATKGVYNQAATDCAINILRIAPADATEAQRADRERVWDKALSAALDAEVQRVNAKTENLNVSPLQKRMTVMAIERAITSIPNPYAKPDDAP